MGGYGQPPMPGTGQNPKPSFMQTIEQNAANRSPLFNYLYGRYLSNRNQPVSVNGMGPNTVDVSGGDTTLPQGPPAPGAPPPPGPDSPQAATMGAADGGMDAGGGLPGFAEGTIVTKPTIAKLAEHGEPEAVIPLTPRPANKMQPDILEGRISEPKVPGVRYQRYKGYNRFGPGVGGQV
jgi:hypothetical protein